MLSLKLALTLGCNILSFSGGGSHGAVEAGIFSKIYQGESYSALLGVSAGSLNSAFLGQYSDLYQGTQELLNLYQTIKTKDIYHPVLKPSVSLFDTHPLNETIHKYLPSGQYQVPTLVGTVNLTSGSFEVFDLTSYSKEEQINLLLASSAIPFVFPPVQFRDTYFVDGGLLNNQIVSNIQCDGFLNLTYITPSYYEDDWTDEVNLKNLLSRDVEILKNSQNNMVSHLYKNCDKPAGEINIFSTRGKIPCKALDFNCGSALVDFGRTHVSHIKYPYCII